MTITPTQPLSPEELASLLADSADESYFELDRRPLPAVLDTACVRTGLHFQIKNGLPPRSVMTARDGSLRLFTEYDTLVETTERLPRFVGQPGVPITQLRRACQREIPRRAGLQRVSQDQARRSLTLVGRLRAGIG